MRSRYCSAGLALVLVVALAGCGVSDEAKSVCATAAMAAKERAAAFTVIKPRLVAADPADRAALQKFTKAHGEGLNAQAAALADLSAAMDKGSALRQSTRDLVKAEADTAKARADNFRVFTAKMAANPDVDVWKEAHQKALDTQAVAIAKLAALLAKQPKTAPPAAPAPIEAAQ